MTDRKTVREALATKLTLGMVGVDKPCQQVFAYQKEKLEGVTPCLVVVSEGTTPNDVELSSPYETHTFGLHTFTLYKDIGTGTANAPEWTEQESEDAMDVMANDLKQTLKLYTDRTNEQNPEWLFLRLGKSDIDSYTDLEGFEFRHEYFPVQLDCLESQ